MIKMATITIKPTKTLRKNTERAIKISSVISFVKRLLPSPGFEQAKSQTKMTTNLDATRKRMAIMTDSIRVNWR